MLLIGRVVTPGIYEPSEPLVLEAKCDYEVLYQAGYRAPFTDGGRATLPAGALVRVQHYAIGATAVSCEPLNYDELHPQIVPEYTRDDPKYTGYGFVIPLDDLDVYFEQVAA